jgi:hypothetical protein
MPEGEPGGAKPVDVSGRRLEIGMHEFRDLRASEEGIGFRTRLIARTERVSP